MIVPDAIEPIVAWRYWDLSGDGLLRSMNQGRDAPWLPGERKVATCSRGQQWVSIGDLELGHVRHEVPYENCRCGIYAAKDRDELRALCGAGDVVGEVYLWGKVIPGEFGYRAQYAYPKSLFLLTNAEQATVEEAEQIPALHAYGCEVGSEERDDDLAFTAGRLISVSLGVSVAQFAGVLSRAAHAFRAFDDSMRQIEVTTSYHYPLPDWQDNDVVHPGGHVHCASDVLPNGMRGDHLRLDDRNKRPPKRISSSGAAARRP